KFGLPIIEVLKSEIDVQTAAWTEDGVHVNSGFLDGLGKDEANEKMIAWLEERNLGKTAINYKLRDWIFSRQRYWGEPIPLVHCPTCGTVALNESDLPLLLPEVTSYEPSGTGESPLAKIDSWVNTTCPVCAGPAKRETNTMPQWAGSCWYYLRYIDPHNTQEFVSREKERYWMPVDLYVGGAEHAVLHLLYARFWHKVLHDLGLVSTSEPFTCLVNQGMITSYAFQRTDKSLVPTDLVDEKEDGTFVERETGDTLERVIAKMSKSLKNVINPDEIITEYGADSMRMYEMFMGPLEVSKPWSTAGLVGVYRFLDRVWRLYTERTINDREVSPELLKTVHKTIKKVSVDTGNLDFNTAIAQMMILVNDLYKEEDLNRQVGETLVLLLAPYVPHIAEELWQQLGHTSSLTTATWPTWDEALTVDSTATLVFQVNGKVRSKAEAPMGLPKDEALALAKADEKVQKWLEGKTVVREIVVTDKLVNIVVK
ncbi:MAG: leucine--tRNA ligase, partial [Sphaerochaeta sp.]|nr:leucine--tRNA ligase [Sphaerochaeta sp.]